ncbi:MAG TPA: methyltransferase domain-containing protein [Solirubrobacteraceae bacterium]|jgi:SAM-dependent methyltransferase|nr:methyltransferase domain-containing protein [Solirubrobacteraceae bacterium]
MNEVVWHDLECGRYREDLPLWLELASQSAGDDRPLLDVGAGTGRVTIPLAEAGHHVCALDLDPVLLSELELRAAGLPVATICADARDFELPGRRFPLILVPMQTVQLLGGRDAHLSFFRRARSHLAEGGLIAVAIAVAEDFEEFEWRDGDMAPLPDIAEIEGRAYFSQPTAVRRVDGTFVLQRHREVVEADGARSSSDDRIALDVLTVEALQQAAEPAGLRPRAQHRIEATEEHIGSEVVVFGV